MFKEFESTLELICSSLTEDVEGGSDSIPFWMFSVCYAFLAQLSYSKEQELNSENLLVLIYLLLNHSYSYNNFEKMNSFSTQPNEKPLEVDARNFRYLLSTEWKKCIKKENPNKKFQDSFDRIAQATEFQEIIDNLIDFGSNSMDDVFEENKNTIINSKLCYEIIRDIGAPWNWINQFVSFYSPHLKSYNFRECHHHECSDDQIIEIEPFVCKIAKIKGINKVIDPERMQIFLAYMKNCSIEKYGLIYPKHFKHSNCPPMS